MNDSMAVQSDSYNPQYFRKIAEVEDRHFWFGARNRIIGVAVSNIVKDLPDGYRLLEVGCGTGVVLRYLAGVCDRGEVMGLDLYLEAVAFAKERSGCRVVAGDVLNPPVAGDFDVIGLFDVLEHLSKESETLQALHRLLKPGGTLVLTVPAHMSLWSYFDVAACHVRRYEQAAMNSLLVSNRFEAEYLTEFMVPLFPLLWLLRRRSGNAPGSEKAATKVAAELKVVPIVNEILKGIIGLERFAIDRRWRLPFGSSLLAIARRK